MWPARIAQILADAESQRTPSGSDRAAATAIIDEVSKTDLSCRADSVLSSVHILVIVSREGRLADGRPRVSSRMASHSFRSPATSRGGVLIVAANREEVRSRPSSI